MSFLTASLASAQTVLRYGAGHQLDATGLAALLRLPSSSVQQGTGSGLTLIIGSDWLTGTTFTGQVAPANTKAALNQAHAETADKSGSCAPVATAETVQLKGVPMTPTQAYDRSPQVPNSAP